MLDCSEGLVEINVSTKHVARATSSAIPELYDQEVMCAGSTMCSDSHSDSLC